MSITAKNQRAKALLKLLEKLEQSLPDDLSDDDKRAQAILHLDEQLGDQWKKEIGRSSYDLEGEAASSKDEMDDRHGVECMYKKIKVLLDANGESPQQLDEGRVPGEEEDDEGIKGKIQIILLKEPNVR